MALLIISLVLILVGAITLGLIKYFTLSEQYKNQKWQNKFAEIWNDCINFLITGFIVYYFFIIRVPELFKGGNFYFSDFILFIIFMLGIFGHLCVASKNITDGIEAILKRVLDK